MTFAVGLIAGIILGIIADFAARLLWERYSRPIIKVPKENKDVWREVGTQANIIVFQIPGQNWYFAEGSKPSVESHTVDYRDEEIKAYRLKVKNQGRSAAENVSGTVVFPGGDERRICWYEGDGSALTLNADDHSFLDVYGVLLRQSGTICMPTENGWKRLYIIRLKDKVRISLRVTAKNASPEIVHFDIDPARACQPTQPE